jgi:hypothetical protein
VVNLVNIDISLKIRNLTLQMYRFVGTIGVDVEVGNVSPYGEYVCFLCVRCVCVCVSVSVCVCVCVCVCVWNCSVSAVCSV